MAKPEDAYILFSVPDFIGYACNQVASRIRQAVAQITFDKFHRSSAAVIQHAVMGQNKDLKFDANNLVSYESGAQTAGRVADVMT